VSVQLFVNYLEGQTPGPMPPQARPAGVPNREPELREWQAIEQIHRRGLFEATEHTALLSPRFPIKTGIAFDQVVAFIEDNPGYDVYLFDFAAQARYYNFNIFDQSENAFPGFQARFIECLAQVGEDVSLTTLGRSLPDNCVCGNGWCGNARFWREVVGDAVDLIGTIRSRPAVWRYLCEPVVHNGFVYPYLPFVLERFVSWWLMTRSGISVKPWPYDKAYVLGRCVRPLERPFVEGFHDLFNEWDAAGPWSPDKQAFVRDLSLAFHRQLRGANDHLVYPWTGERIAPVR
jgi:hypothetical protein